MILIVVDADDNIPQRQLDLQRALEKIRDNHLDAHDHPINNGSAGGLAIRNFETWLLADIYTVSSILDVQIEAVENLEDLNNTKDILEKAITQSIYLSEETSNQRPLQIRWNLAKQIDLTILKSNCPNGYAAFSENLITVAQVISSNNYRETH